MLNTFNLGGGVKVFLEAQGDGVIIDAGDEPTTVSTCGMLDVTIDIRHTCMSMSDGSFPTLGNC